MMSTLSATTESMIRSFLGPCKSNKVVIEDSEFHIVRCPHHLLKETVIQDPFNFVIEDTLESHEENYGCSTTTLLAMWYFWRAEFIQLFHEGHQLSDIVTHSQDILETVVSHLYQIELDLKTLIFPSTGVGTTTKPSNKSAACVGRTLSYSSRHYSPSAANKVDEDELKDVLTNHDVKSRIHSIVEKLSHDEENSGLVSDLWIQQMLSANEIKFCSESMILCPLTLPSSYSSIVEGCIIKSKFLSWYDQEKILQSKALIIKGSLVHDYVHLGGSSRADVTARKRPDEVAVTKKDVWLQKCLSLLEKLQINALLVHGAVDEDIACYCLSHSICLLSHIPWSILEMICLNTNTSPCVYLTDCDEKNVLRNLELKVWRPTDDFTSMDDKFLQIHIAATESVNFFTVVLCHPNPTYLKCLEHQFMHLVSRLSLVVKSSKLLPGSGKTEEWCCNMIKRFAVGNGVKAKIGSAISNGFFKYYDSVKKKLELKGDFSSNEAYDDMESKVQAWKSALCIAIMALQCDTILINDPYDITL